MGVAAAVNAIRKEMAQAMAALEAAKKDNSYAKIGEIEHVTLPDIKRRRERGRVDFVTAREHQHGAGARSGSPSLHGV